MLGASCYKDFGRIDALPNAVAHGVLDGAISLAGSDAPAGEKTARLEGLMLSLLGTADPAVLHEWFDKLSTGGTVVDPLAPKPWGASDGRGSIVTVFTGSSGTNLTCERRIRSAERRPGATPLGTLRCKAPR